MDDRERLVFDIDQFECILGDIAVVCNDKSYSLPYIMYLIEGQRELRARLR